MRSVVRDVCMLALLVVAGSITSAQEQEKKYDVKSGMIVFETTTMEGRIRTSGRVVVYFDDFGRRERKDTYAGGFLKESVLCDGEDAYTVLHDKKVVFKRGPAMAGTEIRFDDEIVSRGGTSGFRLLPAVTIAGYECRALEHVDGQLTMRMAGWSHLLLYREDIQPGLHWIARAAKVDLGVKLSPAMFVPPMTYEARAALF
ncbi:MAG: hypothetical protein AB1428_14015 [Bacteroidota bacterium]